MIVSANSYSEDVPPERWSPGHDGKLPSFILRSGQKV